MKQKNGDGGEQEGSCVVSGNGAQISDNELVTLVEQSRSSPSRNWMVAPVNDSAGYQSEERVLR